MKYFGTDGIRGAYKSELVCESFFKKFAHCVELYFKKYAHRDVLKICVGTDTRESGTSLKKAIISGLSEDTLVFDKLLVNQFKRAGEIGFALGVFETVLFLCPLYLA